MKLIPACEAAVTVARLSGEPQYVFEVDGLNPSDPADRFRVVGPPPACFVPILGCRLRWIAEPKAFPSLRAPTPAELGALVRVREGRKP